VPLGRDGGAADGLERPVLLVSRSLPGFEREYGNAFHRFAFSGFYLSANCAADIDAVGTLAGRFGWLPGPDGATLLYRALTVFPTLALGLLAAATWRTHHPGESIESPSDP